MAKNESVNTKTQNPEDFKKTVNRVRDSAMALTETLKAMREGGAYREIGAAIHESAMIARTIVEEIHATLKDLEQSGEIEEVAGAVREVPQIARQTAEVANAVASKITSKTGASKT
jgi:methyl-accepting chemotaxis protein